MVAVSIWFALFQVVVCGLVGFLAAQTGGSFGLGQFKAVGGCEQRGCGNLRLWVVVNSWAVWQFEAEGGCGQLGCLAV